MHNIKLGDEVKDSITGFKGVVYCITEWLHSEDRASLQPRELNKDSDQREPQTFDVQQLEVIEVHAVKASYVNVTDDMINLGDTVQDSISDFKGVVTNISTWLNGCRRVGVQSDKLQKSGSTVKSHAFDEGQLLIKKRVKRINRRVSLTGGPCSNPLRQDGSI